MNSRLILIAAASIPAAVLLASPAAGQRVGVSLVTATADHESIPSSSGFGIHAGFDLGSGWLAQLSYVSVSDETEGEAEICATYEPKLRCDVEPVENSATVSGLRAVARWGFNPVDILRLGVGGGVSFNQVEAESIGTETGRDADMLVPNGGQLGLLGGISAAVSPIPGIGLAITGGLNAHWIKFRGCSGQIPRRPDPFCGGTTLQEIHVGIEYAF